MSAPSSSPAGDQGPLIVAYPGNTAPHYRVQVLSSDNQPQWKLFSVFADPGLAQICVDRLRRTGQAARLIAFRRVPTAA